MKIKIIELFNRIANGEEVPEKIKHKYLEGDSFDDLIDNLKYIDIDFNKALNEEVEIIEEDKTIKELKTEIENTKRKLIGTSGTKYSIRVVDNILINKINELVKEINKLKEN